MARGALLGAPLLVTAAMGGAAGMGWVATWRISEPAGHGAEQHRASEIRWSAPRRLAIGPTILFRFPDVAPSRHGGAYVAVGPQLEGRETVRGSAGPDRANLLLYSPGGAALPVPPGPFTFTYSRVAVTQDGVLHLVWGEPRDRAEWDRTADRRSVQLGSLWHARWRNGRWSIPERIYENARVSLEPVLSSGLEPDAAGGLHVGFPAEDATGMPLAVHVWHDGHGWSSSEIRSRVPPVYADVLPLRSGSTLMVYVAGYSDAARSYTNALFITAAGRAGTWRPRWIVGGAANWPATEPRLVETSDGAAHLVWLRGAMQGAASLWHACSRDGGRTWSEFRELRLDGLPHGVQAAADSRGAVHVVLTSYRRRRAELLHATWDRGTWSPIEPLSAGRMGSQPSLRGDAAGRLHLSWVAQVPGAKLPERAEPGDTLPWFELDYSVAERARP